MRKSLSSLAWETESDVHIQSACISLPSIIGENESFLCWLESAGSKCLFFVTQPQASVSRPFLSRCISTSLYYHGSKMSFPQSYIIASFLLIFARLFSLRWCYCIGGKKEEEESIRQCDLFDSTSEVHPFTLDWSFSPALSSNGAK